MEGLRVTKQRSARFAEAARSGALAALLAAAAFVLFAPALGYDFVYFDDARYTIENPHVRQGLRWSGIRWAWSHYCEGLWAPLLWMSYMLDVTVQGASAGSFHLTNVLLHSLNVALLFLLLVGAGGGRRRAAWVAAVFAVHPLMVEPVVWIASRKDVLCAFFWILSLHAYLAYGRRPGIGRYALTFACVTLTFLSKPVAVSLPLVLFLLDLWPLGRVRIGTAGPPFRWTTVVLEKMPLLILTIGFCVVAYLGQGRFGALKSAETVSLPARLLQIPEAYLFYLGKTVWPAGLSAVYPVHRDIRWASSLLGCGMVAGISLWAWRAGRRVPALLVGWLWFLVVLVPVIGLIRFGVAHVADRFMYLPLIGLLITACWLPEWLGGGRWHGRWLAAPVAAVVPLLCIPVTRASLPRWQNATVLAEAVLRLGPNPVMENKLGVGLSGMGRHDEAAGHFAEALRLTPEYPEARSNLAAALFNLGRNEEALDHCREALRLAPEFPDAHYNMASILSGMGEYEEAVAHYRRFLESRPEHAAAWFGLGVALAGLGRPDEAIPPFEEGLRLDPDFTEGHNRLGAALLAAGRAREAMKHFRETLRRQPEDVYACNALAWVMATSEDPALRDGAEAVRLGEAARRATGGRHAAVLDTLAAAYAEAGRFEEAVATAETAARLFRDKGKEKLASEAEGRMKLYQEGRPFRERRPGRHDEHNPAASGPSSAHS